MESLLVPSMSFSEIKFEKMRTESKPLVTSEHLEHFEYQTESNMKTFPPPKQKNTGWSGGITPRTLLFLPYLALSLCRFLCANRLCVLLASPTTSSEFTNSPFVANSHGVRPSNSKHVMHNNDLVHPLACTNDNLCTWKLMLHDNSSSHDSLIHLLQKQNSGTTKVQGLSLMCARAPFADELLFLRFRSKDCESSWNTLLGKHGQGWGVSFSRVSRDYLRNKAS